MSWIGVILRLLLAVAGAWAFTHFLPTPGYSTLVAKIGWGAAFFCLFDAGSLPRHTLHPSAVGLARWSGGALVLVGLYALAATYFPEVLGSPGSPNYTLLIWLYATGTWALLRLTRTTATSILVAQQDVADAIVQFGENHASVGVAKNALALAYRSEGRKVKAEEQFNEALDVFRKTDQWRGAGVAAILANKAALLAEMGRYSSAEATYRNALRLKEEIFGADSPQLALTFAGMAALYHRWGSHGKAEHYLQRAYELAHQDAELAERVAQTLAQDAVVVKNARAVGAAAAGQ